MLNKVLVAKFLTAMTLAGFATGAAAGINGDDPADGDTIELEIPFEDEDESKNSDDADDADDNEADDADDEAAEEEAEEDADESDDAAVKEAKDPNHGSIVSDCARNTEETGRAHGEAVSAVAKDDTAECAGLPEQTEGDDEETPAPAAKADEADDDEAEEPKPHASKAQGADHRNEKATEKLAERDARKAGRN